MDAYDIFKKLSKGAVFNKKKPKESRPVQVKIEVKEEIIDQKEKNKTENENITLFSTNSEEHSSKKRKRDLTNDEIERKSKLLRQEEINRYRNENNISVVGKNIPEPAKTFDDFKLSNDLIENIKSCGYSEPTSIQKQAIPIMLENRQILACAPTGSGKTAAFLLPIIHLLKKPKRKGFRALIICPTRELAKQTQKECIRLSEGRNLRVHVISKIKQALTQYGPKSSGKYDILITTPNRICFLLKQEPAGINLANIEWLIVDEADKLFEDGIRSFREQLNQIVSSCTNPNKKVAMFSATYTPTVAKYSVKNLKGLIRVTVGLRNSATSDVNQELLFVGNEDGKLIALRNLIRTGVNPPVLIFVQSKERAQQLFNELIYDGINVDAIHSDRTQQQRDNTIRCFREGKIWVLICTELMARGVDFKGVNLVINYDFPPSTIAYIHRIGRAGRAGRKGKAITYFTNEDTVNLRSIAHVIKQSGQEVPEFMLSLKKQNKKEVKKLKNSAPKRKDITTTPVYEAIRKDKWKKNEKRRVNSYIVKKNFD
ncbi:probable ATP-dependent RNA helicase DDX52 [Onthophagus taurus]|uniref:probable ATP-dependent RNA helicase DDX52 n=1 Tax=Onthophagus taurus TaxID=166361 RepID=UPI0039BDF800